MQDSRYSAALYSAAKRYNDGENRYDLVAEVRSEFPKHTVGTVGIYITSIRSILNGVEFKRRVPNSVVRHVLHRILDEFGLEGAADAVHALDRHIAYAKEVGAGDSLDLVEVVETFRRRYLEPRANETSEPSKASSRADVPPGTLDLAGLRQRAEDQQNYETATTQLVGFTYRRNPWVKRHALAQANGKCGHCKQDAPFRTVEGEPFLEVHHIRPLGEGGADTIENTIALCPNCHREAHFGAHWQKFRTPKEDV